MRRFFASEGKPLLAFDRATRVLETESVPKHETCLNLTRQVLPKIIKDPNLLFPLAQRIPNAELASAFGQDVRLKVLVVLGCANSAASPSDPKAYENVRVFAEDVRRLLTRFGITV